MSARRLFKIFTDLLGCTPFHPQFFSRFFLNRQVRLKSKQLEGIVADLGCGYGPYRKHFLQARYFGFDYPTTRPSDKIEGLDGFIDLECLPLSSACLDGVLCTQVLEHVSDPVQAISEIGRVLKPGGKLLLSTPFFYPLHDEPYDYFRFTPYGINKLLSKADLMVLEIVPQGGFFTMAGEFLNLFCIHKLQNMLSSGWYLKALGYFVVLPFLVSVFLINLM